MKPETQRPRWCPQLFTAVALLSIPISDVNAQPQTTPPVSNRQVQEPNPQANRSKQPSSIRLAWQANYLTISGPQLPRGPISIHYLEAYCRANSHRTDWTKHTVVGHQTKLVRAAPDGSVIELRCHVNDGLIVEHRIQAGSDEVDFAIRAHNPTKQRSVAHWAQPCIRVGRFVGSGSDDTDDAYAYIKKCFVFVDGELRRLPTEPWATQARYTPGQVWAGPGVAAADVNPRPLSPLTPSSGLIGCFRHDDRVIMAVAFAPYQELFQGVIRCLHSDFRLGGLAAGETRVIRGKIYLVDNDVPALLKRYEQDFGTTAN